MPVDVDQTSDATQDTLGLTERPSCNPVRVLIVDASPIVLKRLVTLVSDVPSAVVVGEATDGVKAQELFRRHRPDVIILDIQVPRIDGLDLLVLFKRENPACNVVVLTTYEFEAFRRLYTRLGADHFFNKSTEFERVVDVLSGVQSRPFPGPETDES